MLLVPTSCDDFLSETTDNRTEIDTEAKLESLLKSAYVDWTYSILAELSSDNVDDFGDGNPYTSRFYDQIAVWEEELDRDNDGPYFAWNSYWGAIATANKALAAIDELGGGQFSPVQVPVPSAIKSSIAYKELFMIPPFSAKSSLLIRYAPCAARVTAL